MDGEGMTGINALKLAKKFKVAVASHLSNLRKRTIRIAIRPVELDVICQALVDTQAKLDEAVGALEEIEACLFDANVSPGGSHKIARQALEKIKEVKP
jgi:hypothetical protein